jgi:PKD repeat protein
VKKASALVVAGSSPNPSASGQAVTLRATAVAIPPGGGGPTGSVQFLDGTTILGTAPLAPLAASTNALPVSTGILSVSTLKPGTHTITAVYSGDSNFADNKSPTVTHKVNCGSLSTSLSVAKSTVKSGQTATFKATTTGSYTSWDFDFGDGSPHLNAPANSITHTYTLPKGKTSMTYTAVMKVSNDCSKSQNSVSIKVTQ